MLMLRFEPRSLLTEKECSTNRAVNHCQTCSKSLLYYYKITGKGERVPRVFTVVLLHKKVAQQSRSVGLDSVLSYWNLNWSLV
jgi:hypothetical protein